MPDGLLRRPFPTTGVREIERLKISVVAKKNAQHWKARENILYNEGLTGHGDGAGCLDPPRKTCLTTLVSRQ